MRGSKLAHDGPSTGLVACWLGYLWIRVFGWQVRGEIPPGGKFVLIGAPHTSNWDFIFGLAALSIFRLRISWMGKDSLFKKPFGWFMKKLGGIPIDRKSPHGVVDQIIERYKKSDKLVILVTPCGTRSKREYWKSGFYWIAQAAQVPLLCGSLDYKKKEGCIGLSFVPTGNISADMTRIREFYEGRQGKFPHQVTPVRLKDEEHQTSPP